MRLKWNCPACSAINTEQYNPAVINNGETDSVLSFCSNCNKQIELYVTLSIETDWVQKVDGKIGTISDKSHRNSECKTENEIEDNKLGDERLLSRIEDMALSFAAYNSDENHGYYVLKKSNYFRNTFSKRLRSLFKSIRNNDFKTYNKVSDKTFNEDKLIAKIRSLVGNLKVGFSGTYEPFSLREIKNIDQFETDVINAVLEEIIRS